MVCPRIKSLSSGEIVLLRKFELDPAVRASVDFSVFAEKKSLRLWLRIGIEVTYLTTPLGFGMFPLE